MTVHAGVWTDLAERRGTIDLWLWQPNLDPGSVAAGWSLLDANEQERARKFFRDEDARRFCVIHGKVRQILGRHCGVPPEALEFAATGNKKPTLRHGWPEFNLSHSGDTAALAVSDRGGLKLGVDIETVRPIEPDVLPLIFSDTELEHLKAMPPDAQERAIIRGWTWKEAILKASGLGLYVDPREVVFDLSYQAAPKLKRVPPQLKTKERWAFACFDVSDKIACCLATRRSAVPLNVVVRHLDGQLSLDAPNRPRTSAGLIEIAVSST